MQPLTHLGFANSPAKTLEDLYQKVYQTQMKGLSICNEEINVEAVDFQLWQGQWVGILITPWFTNLLILRQQGREWPEFKLGKGNEQHINFPAGDIKFTPRFEPELGSYLCCSLVSPMNECPSHQKALTDAKNALRQLVQIPITMTSVSDDNINNEALSAQQKSRRSFLNGKRQLA